MHNGSYFCSPFSFDSTLRWLEMKAFRHRRRRRRRRSCVGYTYRYDDTQWKRRIKRPNRGITSAGSATLKKFNCDFFPTSLTLERIVNSESVLDYYGPIRVCSYPCSTSTRKFTVLLGNYVVHSFDDSLVDKMEVIFNWTGQFRL